MRIVDITLPLSAELACYPGDPEFEMQRLQTAEAADPSSYTLSRVSFGSHFGTHVDTPLHLGGAAGVEELDLSVLCGPARVVDLRGAGRALGPEVLASAQVSGAERLLLRTQQGSLRERPMRLDHAYLTREGACFLRDEVGVRLVGIDCFSIDPSDGVAGPGYPAHRELLFCAAPVVVVEGLDLSEVEAGEWELWCLPLPLRGGDGAPARAVLVQR